MSLSMRRVRALVAKDFAIHGRDIFATMAGVLGIAALLPYLRPAPVDMRMSAIFTFNFLLAGFWSDWLISREKAKGTFAWIRSSPVDDRELVLSKFAGVSACVVGLWGVSSFLFAADYWRAGRLDLWAVLQLILLAFAALAVGTRWRFGQKLGQNLPFLLVGAVMMVLVVAARDGEPMEADPERMLRDSDGMALLALFAAGAFAAAFWWTLRWVRRSDTADLLE